MTWLTATLGPKGQITLPKPVRLAMKALSKGDLIGFALDEKTGSVRLAKMDIRPAVGSLTAEELKKLLKISGQGKKEFATAQDFLKHLGRL